MIYLDNAATGGFKPRAVTEVVETVTKYLCANPGRSGHSLSLTAERLVLSCREKVADFFSCSFDRVVFTKNCTEALNLAIFGTLKRGGHVITTTFEHNSVLRPLFHLAKKGYIELDIVCPTIEKDILEVIKEKITPKTYLIACTSCSNVTGKVLPIRKIGELCKENNLLFLVDGAQGAGHIPLSIKDDHISMLALAGHKGLYGIMGSGALVFSDQVDISPLILGGTGTETFNPDMPLDYPERLEAGTLSLPAIASLEEGVKFIKNNLFHFSEQIEKTTEKIIGDLYSIDNIKLYSRPNPAGIIAFNLKNLSSNKVADVLSNEFDIAVRGGFQCAPLTHKYLNTLETGVVRVSLAVQNSSSEISCLTSAVKKIAKGRFFGG
ncbi:MAG: aminotransferase class V-fold PLP-dependent enzyme [Clostridia bacterium]|nr:aminotransferase class V-fold PLP-dependent enzyme [Clostridia bacterium]